MRTEEIQQLLNKLPECGFAVKKSMHFATLHFALGFFFSIFVGRLTTYSSNQSQTFGNVFTGKMSLFRDIIAKETSKSWVPNIYIAHYKFRSRFRGKRIHF